MHRAGDKDVKNELRHLHLHLVSDATGETLLTVARAATAQYPGVSVVEHIHAMTRSPKQIELPRRRACPRISKPSGSASLKLQQRVMQTALKP